MPSYSTNLLAPDIWYIIASLSPKCSLNNLSQTSTHFLEIFRPLLYRAVDFNWEDESFKYPEETLKLLSADKKLAKCVQSLTIYRQRPPIAITNLEPLPAFYLDTLLRNMTSLKKLEFIGQIFNDAIEQK